MKKIITLLLLSVTLIMANEYKVVFNLTSGDEKSINSHLIKNIEALKKHYKSQGDTLKVAVVISGDSYKYFRNDVVTSLDTKLQSLANRGVEFQVCSIGLKKHSIKISSLDQYVKPAFNRTAALIEYQNTGYAYIKIN
jgi:intracellular sulfur oxidation DsrE/DsrF family protein